MSMRRTQVLLEPAQHAALHSWATRDGISLSHLLRLLVDRALEAQSGKKGMDCLDQIVGLVSDGTLAEEDHDRIIYDDEMEPD